MNIIDMYHTFFLIEINAGKTCEVYSADIMKTLFIYFIKKLRKIQHSIESLFALYTMQLK